MRRRDAAVQFTNVCILAGACHIPGMEKTPDTPPAETATPDPKPTPPKLPKEIGGAPGPEPTRYGDWAHKGRVTDF